MSTKVNELTPKVDRYTVTDPDGQLSATEYNVILDAVQRHETQLVDNDFLRFSEQALDDNDKRQARQNIGVVGEDDYAPKMSVGFADNLIGRGEATAEEFTYRPTNGKDSIEDEVARVTRIKGNSVVWNQRATFRDSWAGKGLTCVKEGNTIHLYGTVTEAFSYDLVSLTGAVFLKRNGRKYFVSIDAPTGVTYGISGYELTNHSPFIWSQTGGADWEGAIGITTSLGTTIDYTFKNPIIADLTKMFGAGNEPTTVEEFYARIPSDIDITAYNEGEIIDLNTKTIKTVGFNQWDEQWELGYLTPEGSTDGYVQNYIRAKNYIPVIAGEKYYAKIPNGTSDNQLYAVDKNFNLVKQFGRWVNTEFVVPDGASYIRFYLNYGSETYNNDICINLSHTGYKNGTYEPYREFTRELPVIKKYFPNGMRRAGNAFDSIEWDSSKQKWVAVQRVGTVDLGSLEWTNYTADSGFTIFRTISLLGIISPPVSNDDIGNILCSKYITLSFADVYWYYEGICVKPSGEININHQDINIDAFVSDVQGVILNYELAEPIVTEIEEENINFDYDAEDFGTEEALSSVPSAPFSADIIYKFNAVDSIRQNKLDIKDLQELDATLQSQVVSLQSKASQADGQISELQNEVEELSDEISKIAEDVGLYYGIEWDATVADTAKTRIGDTLLHKSLPVQSNMRGCLLDDDGNVVEYLPRQSWVGQTLDGSKGQVMVEIPEHYRKFEQNGTTRRCMISEYPLPGYHCVPKMYISAYEATLQRSTTTLASVMSEDADYRGGNNNADWDGTYRSLLGRPATVINRTTFRNYARKRKSSTTEWNCQDYNAYKAVFWLYMVEYANSNSQLAFNAEKDANGFAQGGLGNGVTTISSPDWSAYNSYYPFVPCGHTNSLGNASGEVAYEMLQEDGSVLSTVYANRYRGIENLFGHILKWTDGINIQIEPNGTGDSSSKVYVADDTANYNDSNYDGYTMRGLAARSNGYVRELVFGEFGDIMPAIVGGGSTTFWADNHNTNIPTAEALRGVMSGGHSDSGAAAGFAYVNSGDSPSLAYARIGSRLCFIPEKK